MEQISPTKFRATKYVGVYLGIILLIISFGTGIMVGRYAEGKKVLQASAEPDVAKLINIDRSSSHSDQVDFNQFWDVWDRVRAKYVKKGEIKDVDMFYGAIQGMVASLGDPYSLYFPPKAATEFMQSLSGEFEGIGAEIGIKNDQLVVVAPIANSPAEKAGLKPGDKILAIDTKSTAGMDVNGAVDKIRGKANTAVTLMILREGISKPFDVTITRAKINVPAVSVKNEADNVVYVRVMQFNDDTIPQFEQAIRTIQKQKASGVIIDLRNNPGGYLDGAVEFASKWVKNGKIVSEKFSDGTENTHTTVGNHPLNGTKTVVLVNGGSASASEIVAGALQDYKLATIIGTQTFGKGSVQDYENFSDGSALKITVAEWFTPHENNINKKGITPDIEVKEDFSKEKVGEDVMIQKAMEIITGKIVATSTTTSSSR